MVEYIPEFLCNIELSQYPLSTCAKKSLPLFNQSSTFRDADETISWISEKDAVLSSDDFGKDLASVQTLQRKHEGIERDRAALEVSSSLE